MYFDIDAWLTGHHLSLLTLLGPLVSLSDVTACSAAEVKLHQAMLQLALQQLSMIILAIHAYWQHSA